MLLLRRRLERAAHEPPTADVATRRLLGAVLRREDVRMAMVKRESWAEAEVLAFPAGEHDYFDRKASAFIETRESIAKAISAFANSGGGHVLIGVLDDGTLEGITPVRGRTDTRKWVEQVIPSTVSPPMSDFRVHE